MFFAFQKLEFLKPNLIRFTLAMAYQLCKRECITVIEDLHCRHGVYFVLEGKHFIALNPNLHHYAKLEALLHELAHYYLHAPEYIYTDASFCPLWHSKHEREAEAVALVLMYPIYQLEELKNELMQNSYFANALWRREKVKTDYGW